MKILKNVMQVLLNMKLHVISMQNNGCMINHLFVQELQMRLIIKKKLFLLNVFHIMNAINIIIFAIKNTIKFN